MGVASFETSSQSLIHLDGVGDEGPSRKPNPFYCDKGQRICNKVPCPEGGKTLRPPRNSRRSSTPNPHPLRAGSLY